jgi:uncharacterized membrane protein HdeD (DUF308 family)
MKKYWFEDLMMSDLMEKGMLIMAHVALIAGVICLILKAVGAQASTFFVGSNAVARSALEPICAC